MISAGLTVESKLSGVRLRTSEASSARTLERPARRREDMIVNRMADDRQGTQGTRTAGDGEKVYGSLLGGRSSAFYETSLADNFDDV